ncbi:hypothetical protein CLU83_1065 [Flavobacterium sp. 1]|uniref:hypothetical protein n=1 Tax=Flavobacterium sp. 1 TaxID=2035200 RepID=UPI000C233ECE|nr:hypothetical protein [Flavobacterium sp. 1]PJJ07857.1 hypothetical protein CLU83_1065 [Flavobacterium sp. 1]
MEIKDYVKSEVLSSFISNPTLVQRTSIGNVMPMLDRVIFSIERPDSGTNQGGIAYIKEITTGKLIKMISIPGMNTPVTGLSIQSDELNFETKSYVLEYGPDHIDKGVKSIAATVDIIQATPMNYQPSTCNAFNNSDTHIQSRYHLPKEILQDGNVVMIYAVEGDKLLSSDKAIANKIFTLSKVSPNHGTALLENYPEGTFKRGKTYSVCLNVYSWARQIAGYQFVY